MEKNIKRIKTIAVVLIILLITAIAFCGLYFNKQGVWKNILPKFSYGMELDGVRELRFILDTSEEEKEIYVDAEGNYAGDVVKKDETSENTEAGLVDEEGKPVNSDNSQENSEQENPEGYTKETRTVKANEDEQININNFEKAKKIIQERLETIDLYEYNIRLDNITGELVVEVPDNQNIEIQKSLITTIGKFEIIDSQNGLILIDNSNIKKVSATYGDSQDGNGYQAYLVVQLDKIGTEKLKEISKNYIETTDEAGNTSTKYVSVEFDDNQILETYFGEELANGTLRVPIGQASQNYEEFATNYNNIIRISKMLSLEKMPLSYKLNGDNYIQSYVTDEIKLVAIVSFSIIVLIISIVMIIKHKAKGLKLAISNVGYIAILTLIFRYTNVMITFNSLIALIGVVGINLLFSFKLLDNLKESNDVKTVFVKTMKELYLAIIPVCIIAIIFTFMSGVVISSIGMVLFWGIAIQALYSAILYFLGYIN